MAAPGTQGDGKEAGTPTFSFAFPIQLLCDLVFVFPCPVYSVLILGWFSKWNTHFGWEGFMCNSGTSSSFLSGERRLVSALCLLIVFWFV